MQENQPSQNNYRPHRPPNDPTTNQAAQKKKTALEKATRREILIQDLPPNSCSALTAFELIQDCHWISKTSITSANNPRLTDCLRRYPRLKFSLNSVFTELTTQGI